MNFYRVSAVLILSLLLAPARAAFADAGALGEKSAQLKEVASILEQISDEEYLEASLGGGTFGTRHEALGSVYKTLAALEYRQSLSGGLPERTLGAAEESRERLLEDSELLAIDPDSLAEAGWWGRVQAEVKRYSNRRYTVRTPTAVAGVRGGREIKTKVDRKIAKINKSLEAVSRDLKKGISSRKKANLHYRTARIYEKLAKAVSGKDARKPRSRPSARRSRPAPLSPAPALSPRDIYKYYAPAVVLLMCVGSDGNGELGTGSIIDDSGRILTNAHVVIRRSTGRPFDTIRVYFKPKRLTGDPKRDLTRHVTGRVTAFDRDLDLAIVELDGSPSRTIRPIPLGDAGAVEAGEPVLAIGHPEQGGLWTLTTGVVSTVIANLGGVKGKDVFQTDASINRGNSGGPLLDNKGALIGVNTSMARKAKDGLTITAVNFSVKSSVVKDWLAKAGVKADYYQAEGSYPAEARPKAAPKPKPAGKKPAARPARKPKPVKSKPKILTPKKPFSIQSLIQREIAQMEDLESEMRGEIDKRRGWFEQQRLKRKRR